MYVARYVMSRIFVFWLSVAILVYGWFNHANLVNDGFRASGTLVKGLTKVDQTGKAETLMVHVLHLEDLVVIGFIMLLVTLVLTAARNLALGSSEHRMTVVKAVGHLIVLLVLSYVVLAAVWWYDARLVNTWFDVSRVVIGHVAAAIDPGGQLELVLRTLGLARHLVAGCLMLVLALGWEMVKWALRGARALSALLARSAKRLPRNQRGRELLPSQRSTSPSSQGSR
jgi:hypothetical protein